MKVVRFKMDVGQALPQPKNSTITKDKTGVKEGLVCVCVITRIARNKACTEGISTKMSIQSLFTQPRTGATLLLILEITN